MARNSKAIALILVSAISLGMAAMTAARQAPSAAPEAPTYSLREIGVIPLAAIKDSLLEIDAVQQELKITDAQKQERKAIGERNFQKLQKARLDNRDRAKFIVARDAIVKVASEAVQATLKPEQRRRLDEIHLQAQGPLAFVRPEVGPIVSVEPSMIERLKLSEDQVRKIKAIVRAGGDEIQKATSFPIPLDSKEKPTQEAIRKLVESPEFQGAKQKAGQAGRDAWAAVIRRIEVVLTEPQRESYHKLIGAPFDLSKLRWGPQDDRQVDIMMVSRALGIGGGGQRADPDFNTKVARPAYADASRHPRVLLDEAHHNFHTAGGRYKPFADLITSDGYQVIPSKEKFSREMLRKGDILVIANALGAEGMREPEASNPAFTDAECDAVRDWVKDGGSLLFITDHAPMGSAAECLAKRFGVAMSKGTALDPSHSDGGAARLVFTRQDGLLADHPITRGRDASEQVNRVMTFTGQSLKGPEGSVPILKLADTAIDSSIADGDRGSGAGRAQGLAFAFGQGRVVVLGEAAQLSAQIAGVGRQMGMNVPGIDNRQMALNILHWLSGLLEPREAATKKAG
jgi:Spy/CpxP family protein refolding chaperone